MTHSFVGISQSMIKSLWFGLLASPEGSNGGLCTEDRAETSQERRAEEREIRRPSSEFISNPTRGTPSRTQVPFTGVSAEQVI